MQHRPTHSHRRIAVSLAMAALLVAAWPAAPVRADALADLVGALDPAIRDVSIAGAFKAEGRQGVYRLVLTRGSGDAPPSRLFVQWIAVAADGTAKLEKPGPDGWVNANYLTQDYWDDEDDDDADFYIVRPERPRVHYWPRYRSQVCVNGQNASFCLSD